MDENSILNSIFPLLKQGSDIVVGPGDDCAVIDIGNENKYFLIAADQIISNVHYDPLITTPKEAGAKLLKRNLSDIAAMGGYPSNAVVTLASENYDIPWIHSFYEGLTFEANKWNVSICGGDLSSIKKVNLFPNMKIDKSAKQSVLVTTLTITGYVDKNKLCLRSNAKSDDILFATGLYGNSYNSKHHLTFTPRIEEADFIASTYSKTIMDVTDGILIDLQRITKASNVTAKLYTKKIPFRKGTDKLKNALTDGEDYELLFAVPQEKAEKLMHSWPFKTKLTKIGKIIDKIQNIDIIDNSNKDLISIHKKNGWDHIRN